MRDDVLVREDVRVGDVAGVEEVDERIDVRGVRDDALVREDERVGDVTGVEEVDERVDVREVVLLGRDWLGGDKGSSNIDFSCKYLFLDVIK